MFSLLFSSVFILGLLVGSFVNVLIYRHNTGLSAVSGRSQCLSCGHKLAWYENIPLFSFVFLRGKCLECKTKISWQYPVVELVSGVLFVALFVRQYNLYKSLYSFFENGLVYSAVLLIFYFAIASILLVISVYDFKHKIIPDAFVYWFIGLSLLKLVVFLFFCLPSSTNLPLNTAFSFPYVFDLLAPLIFFFPFWLLWFVSDGRWIGFGDAKLVVGIGALLGFVSGLSAIVLGFWIGAGVCLCLLLIQHFLPGLSGKYFKHLGANTEVPFGPFLILGTLIVLFTSIDVMGIAGFFGM
jgi:leader peptidase (prepilin peptidase) / N-methyltransferase